MSGDSHAGEDVLIDAVLCSAGRGGFFFDDQAAIRHGADHDGFDYGGTPETAGFARIRQPAESVSVMLLLSNGDVAFSDCVAVQYSGAGGRDELFEASKAIDVIDRCVRPQLEGRSLGAFRDLAVLVDEMQLDGRPLHSAIRYGVTQALLSAVATAKRITMAEVIRDEYRTASPLTPVPMFVQCGDERYASVEKMILKSVAVLPHGLINNASTKVGVEGEIFVDYLAWVRERVFALRTSPEYSPLLHFDVYGTIGEIFGNDRDRICDYLARLEGVAAPLRLRLEHPLDAGDRSSQIHAMAGLRRELARRGVSVEIVADEWCNTLEDITAFVEAGAADVIHVKLPDLGGINNAIEALLYVRAQGLKAYCGGSCTETERTAQVSAHVAMACAADQVLAKPGMGVDEGLMIVGNEMARVVALVGARGVRPPAPRPGAC